MKRFLCVILTIAMVTGMFVTASASSDTEIGAVNSGIAGGGGSGGGGGTIVPVTPVEPGVSGEASGYIYKIEEESDVAGNLIVIVHMYGDNGEIVSYECADSVIINGDEYSNAIEVSEVLRINTYAGFFVDSDNKIYSIEYTADIPENRQINAKLESAYFEDGIFVSEITFNYANKAATAYQAVYDNQGKLIDFSKANISAGQTELKISTTIGTAYTDVTAKIMFWDRLNKLRPYSESITAIPSVKDETEIQLKGVITENFTTKLYDLKRVNKTADKTVILDVTDNFDTDNEDFQFDLAGKYVGVKNFFVGDTNAEDFLGQAVIISALETDNGYEITSVEVDETLNEVLTIPLEEYASHTLATATSSGKLKYYKDGAAKTTEIEIPAGENFAVVFNGVGSVNVVDLDEYLTDPCVYDGKITLINNDNSEGYDVAIAELASVGVVDEVYGTSVIFKNDCILYDGNVLNELDMDDAYVKITKDGTEIQASELQENDVLAVYAFSDYSFYMYAEVITNIVTGTIDAAKKSVTSAYPSSTGLAYRINGVWYDIALGADGTQYFEIDAGGTFYIGENKKIMAFVPDMSNINYGYILGVFVDEPDFGGGAADLKVQMLTADGVGVYSVKNNAKVEYAGYNKVALSLYDWIVTKSGSTVTVTGDNGDWVHFQALTDQVVQYETNSNGYLTLITEAGYDRDFDVRTAFARFGNEYDAVNKKFGNGGYVAENAKIFIVDSEAANCRIGSIADLEHKNRYDVFAGYTDCFSNNAASVLVISYASMQTSMSSNLAVVVDAYSASNADGEPIWIITYLRDGEECIAETNADVAAWGIMPSVGDMLKIKVGSDGVITNIEEVWTDVVRPANSNRTAYAGYYAAGNMMESFDGGIVTNWDNSYNDAVIGGNTYSLSKAENIYVVDSTGRYPEINNGSVRDFEHFPGLYGITAVNLTFLDGTTFENVTPAAARGYADHIYIREYDGDIKDVVIVKGFVEKVEPYIEPYIESLSSLAVVVEAGSSTNDDGEEVSELTYLVDGEEVIAGTDADVGTGTMPELGDVVKIKVEDIEKIKNIGN